LSEWQIVFEERAAKQLFKLGAVDRKRIQSFIEHRILANGNPRTLGKALVGELSDLWSYRIGDYRILARIKDDVLVVLVVEVGNRREVYR
jgi:mRNA interferase RelE/StbE